MARPIHPNAFANFEAFRASDKWWPEYHRASQRACDARAALTAGSSRARVTSANAKWMRAAEARDRREEELRKQWDDAHATTLPPYVVSTAIKEA